jgi:uncharacterized protein YlbG (UPF0298 family)
MNDKAAEYPKCSGFNSSFPSRNDFLIKNFFTIQMSLEVFQSNGNESRKILIFAALTFISLISRYGILYAKYVDLLDKVREVKKNPIFPTVQKCRQICSTVKFA